MRESVRKARLRRDVNERTLLERCNIPTSIGQRFVGELLYILDSEFDERKGTTWLLAHPVRHTKNGGEQDAECAIS